MVLEATAILGLILTAVFVRRIDWGVYALVAALPFERLGSWALNPVTGHPVVRLSQIVGAALVLAFALRVVARRERLLRPALPLVLLAGFVLSAGVSALLIGQRALVNGWVALAFVSVLAYVLFCLSRRLNWRILASVWLITAGVVSVFGLYQFVAGALGWPVELTALRPAYDRGVFGFPRVQSTALEPLYFANYLLIPLLLSFMLGLSRDFRWRRWHWPVLGVTALAFVLTMSRGAFIALAAALALGGVLLLWQRRHWQVRPVRWRWLIGSAVLVVAGGLTLIGGATMVSRGSFTEGPRQFVALVTTQLTTTGSYTEREQMRQQAMEIFADHPLWGVGVEGISPYVRHYPAVRSQDDVIAFNNQFWEVLAETGIIGALWFYGFLVALVLSVARSWRQAGPARQAWLTGLALAVVAITVQAQSYSGFLLTHAWVTYALLAGAVAVARTEYPGPIRQTARPDRNKA